MHSFYHISLKDTEATKLFKQHIYSVLGLQIAEVNPEHDTWCRNFVETRTRRWKRNGLVIKKDGIFQRSEIFDKEWTRRYQEWAMRTLHTRNPNDAESEVSSAGMPSGTPKHKRVRLPI